MTLQSSIGFWLAGTILGVLFIWLMEYQQPFDLRKAVTISAACQLIGQIIAFAVWYTLKQMFS